MTQTPYIYVHRSADSDRSASVFDGLDCDVYYEIVEYRISSATEHTTNEINDRLILLQ